MKLKPIMWWRRKRKTDSPVWHFEKDCPSLPWDDEHDIVVFYKNPRSGTKCDHCQRLAKKRS